MEVKRIVAAYFSPTGTTARAVGGLTRGLSARLGAPITTRNFTLPKGRKAPLAFAKEDLVVFATPVYAGRVPNVLLPFLRGSIQGGGALAVPVVVYGNRHFDDALAELRDIVQAGGLHTVAAAALVGEHAFSHTLGAHRPDADDMQKIEAFAAAVASGVVALGAPPAAPVAVPGQSPQQHYYTPRDRAGNPINILKVKPKVGKGCTRCGVCAAVCPLGSISPEDITQYVGICIKCGACVKKCPQKARYYDDAGYLYHKAELEEEYARRAMPQFFAVK